MHIGTIINVPLRSDSRVRSSVETKPWDSLTYLLAPARTDGFYRRFDRLGAIRVYLWSLHGRFSLFSLFSLLSREATLTSTILVPLSEKEHFRLEHIPA